MDSTKSEKKKKKNSKFHSEKKVQILSVQLHASKSASNQVSLPPPSAHLSISERIWRADTSLVINVNILIKSHCCCGMKSKLNTGMRWPQKKQNKPLKIHQLHLKSSIFTLNASFTGSFTEIISVWYSFKPRKWEKGPQKVSEVIIWLLRFLPFFVCTREQLI